MSHIKTGQSSHKILTHDNNIKAADVEMWRNAIEGARQQLREAEGRVMRLRAAIRIFEQKIKNGEPWPR